MNGEVATRGRLRWRCRRGMRELDQAMNSWLDQRHESASAEEQAAFAELVEWQDPDIVLLLSGQRAEARFTVIVEHMRAALVAAAGTDNAARH